MYINYVFEQVGMILTCTLIMYSAVLVSGVRIHVDTVSVRSRVYVTRFVREYLISYFVDGLLRLSNDDANK